MRRAPDLLESFRMRLARDATFRRRADLVHASNCPKRMIDRAIELWSPRSVIDMGCGTGAAMGYWIERHVDAHGVEASTVCIEASAHRSRITRADLSRLVDLHRRFDLVYCFEVAEHIHPNAADTFVENLARHGDRVLMTAARPGQGGMGHLNEQEPAYWVARFAEVGFGHDEQGEAAIKAAGDLCHENVLVFRRAEAPA